MTMWIFALAGFPIVAHAAAPEKLTEESVTIERLVDVDDERVMRVEEDIYRVADEADRITPGFGNRIAQCVSDVIDGLEPTAVPESIPRGPGTDPDGTGPYDPSELCDEAGLPGCPDKDG